MRFAGGLIVAVVMVLPAPVFAQAVTREALIGTWAGQWSREAKWGKRTGVPATESDTLILHADSTVRKKINLCCMDNGYAYTTENARNWSLSGDTLRFYFRDKNNDVMFYKVTLEDQQLALDKISHKSSTVFGSSREVYRRVK